MRGGFNYLNLIKRYIRFCLLLPSVVYHLLNCMDQENDLKWKNLEYKKSTHKNKEKIHYNFFYKF